MVLERLVRSEVFDVPGTDPLAMAGVTTILALTAFVACAGPARRAARLDPMSALRRQ